MKFTSIFVPLALIASTAVADSVKYDNNYDDAGKPLTSVACSDGPNGLMTKGFTTFGSLPSFPLIGSTAAVAGWNSPNCGTCWQLTYTNASGAKKSINALAIDHAESGFVLSQKAMDLLTGGQAVALGTVQANVTQLAASACGLKTA